MVWLVTNHSGNTFNYATVPSWKTKHHYYFEGRKEFLDQEGEWWVDTYIIKIHFIMKLPRC